MSDSPLVVLLKIAAMFLVLLVGWLARRRNLLSTETTSSLSRFVVDIAMPAMIFTQMLKTVNPQQLLASWYLPITGAGLIIIGQVVGMATAPFFTRGGHRPTYIFLSAVSNWVYIPLAIAGGLFGDAGINVVLMNNIGAQITLWTLGVWIIRGARPDKEALGHLVTNPGLVATLLGIVIAVFIPASRSLETITQGPPLAITAGAIVQGLAMVGSLTIPLSLVVTGAQLGSLDLSDHRPSPALTGVLASRLVLAPLLTIALIKGIAFAGFTIPEVPRMVLYIIAAMPVAVTCSIFTERFNGDVSLGAKAIFYSTLLSIASVPIFYVLIRHFRY
jgi:predicted permease